MINVFEIAANDQSIVYLGQIFGNVGGSLGGGKGIVVLAGVGSGILGAMFQTFNTGLLALGALLVAYTTVVGVLKTASEGEFLGKWHSLWVPLRTVIGIAGLMPTNTGYCIMQMIIMWIILQGVGAADAVWTAAINYIQSGGATQIPTSGMANAGTQQDVQTLFTALVCQAGAKAQYSDKYYCYKNTDDPFCGRPDSDMLNVLGSQSMNGYYEMGPISGGAGACGILQLVPNSDDPAPMAAARLNAYQSMVPALGQIAKQFVYIDYVFTSFLNTSPTTPGFTVPTWVQAYCTANHIAPGNCNMLNSSMPQIPTYSSSDSMTTVTNVYWPYSLNPYTGGNFLQQNIALYQGFVLQALTTSSNSKGVMSWGATLDTTGLLNQAKANGWITAGGYYYAIANLGNSTQAGVNKRFVTVRTQNGAPIPYDQIAPFSQASDSVKSKIKTLAVESNALIQQINNEQSAGNGGITSGSNCNVPFLGDLCTVIVTGFEHALTGNSGLSNSTNPIISLQVFGESILITIQIVFVVMLAVVLVSVSGAQTMSSLQGWGYGLSAFYNYVITPILFFMGAMFVFAGTLAVYIPMVPYIIFTFGAIGWFIATIEAMIAAPLVSLGIMSPEGKHEIFGSSEAAIGILFNIFLRPTLMIFGMIAGMQLSYVVVRFINAAFAGVMSQVNPAPGIAELVIFLFIYTSLVLTSLNKCFSLIYLIPDHALRWIGMQHGMSFGGEEKALGEVGGGAKAGAGAAMEAGKGAGQTAGEHGKAQERKADQVIAERKQQEQLAAAIGEAVGKGKDGGGGKDGG